MKDPQATSLYFSVRPRVLLKYGGQLLLVFSVLTIVTFIFSLVVGEYHLTWSYASVVIATGLAGFLLQRLEAPANIQNNEALALSAGIFIITPLIASIPFQQSGLLLIDAILRRYRP